MSNEATAEQTPVENQNREKRPAPEQNADQVQNKKKPPPHKPGSKPPRKPRTFTNDNKRPGIKGAEFEKQKTTATIFTHPIRPCFEIQTCFIGASILAHIVYDIIHARDNKMTNLFTVREFQYVVLLRTYFRAIEVARSSATAIVHDVSYLKDSISGILLPDVICKYIEIIGKVITSADITVAPYIRSYHIMTELDDFIDPKAYLTHEQRDNLPDIAWPVNDAVILRVQQGMTRALKGILEIRSIKKEIEGSAELLVGYEELRNGQLRPFTSQKTDLNVAELGACLRFRTTDVQQHSGIRLPMVHEGPVVSADLHLTSWVLKQLKH